MQAINYSMNRRLPVMKKSIVLKTIFITGVLFFLISVADARQSELEKCAARMNDYTAYFKEISIMSMAEKDNRTVSGYMSILGDIAGHYADLINIMKVKPIRLTVSVKINDRFLLTLTFR